MHPLKIGIIGTGPAALMAGTILAESGHSVHFFDQSKAPGRKFLVAGHGGFNLTHSEEIESFISRYDCDLIRKSVQMFTNNDFVDFLKRIGIETYVGTSGKVFPVKGIKPIQVLTAWLDHLRKNGSVFHMESRMVDFNGTEITLAFKGSTELLEFDKVIFALGGGSWSRTGSDGSWLELFRSKGIKCSDLRSSNSGYEINGIGQLPDLHGATIKNCKVFSDRIEKYGDVVLTEYGIEGAPVYALNGEYRDGKRIFLDLKPDLDNDTVLKRLKAGDKRTEALKAMRLSKGAIGLLKAYLSKDEFLDVKLLSRKIKKFELPISGVRPVDEVISTVGGIERTEISENFELNRIPGLYCIGEMVDWDAPTGGYLIQGCVSSGVSAARSVMDQS
jgi:uncharacterized flavoprotein (TIGR03862 family)